MRKAMASCLYLALICSLATVSAAQATTGAASTPKAPVSSSHQEVAGKPRVVHQVIYTNRLYGFSFYLPKSWKGYSIVEKDWDGTNDSEAHLVEHGPLILIRHPLWTEDEPYEDIPIMVFSRKQWREVNDSALDVTAAPFPPGEIGRNHTYVFAVPPRFFYDYSNGWEEVCRILNGDPLRAFSPSVATSIHSPRTGAR